MMLRDVINVNDAIMSSITCVKKLRNGLLNCLVMLRENHVRHAAHAGANKENIFYPFRLSRKTKTKTNSYFAVIFMSLVACSNVTSSKVSLCGLAYLLLIFIVSFCDFPSNSLFLLFCTGNIPNENLIDRQNTARSFYI